MLLKPIKTSTSNARKELKTLKKWVSERDWFSESEIVEQLRKAKHLCSYLGRLNPTTIPTHMSFEVNILGAFRADLVLGDPSRRRFVFVEFEGGQRYSIHSKRGTGQHRDWSREFSKGWSQLIDWSWAMKERNEMLVSALGCSKPRALYLLVCGRNSCFSGTPEDTELARYEWLEDNARIGGAQIVCMTYDGMLDFLAGSLVP